MHDAPLKAPAAPSHHGVMIDLTETRRTEELRSATHRAQVMADRMRAVAAAAAGVVGAQSLPELQEVLIGALQRVIAFDSFTFAVYREATESLYVLGSCDLDVYGPGRSMALAGRPSERVIRERRSLVTHRSDDPAAQGAILWGTGRRSESTIRSPILHGGRVLGVLSIQSYTPDLYADEDVEVLEAVAALAANALENVRLASERRQAEGALRESEERFRALVENSPDIIARFDRGFRHLYVNPVVEKVTGIPPAAFLGRTNEEVGLPGEQAALWRDRLREVFESGEERELAFHYDAPHGRVWLQTRLAPEHAADGSVASVLEVTREVTREREVELALRESEEQLRQSQKMEAVGRLAGGIAHDFNNMLTAIKGFATLLELEMEPSEESSFYLREIQGAAARSASLTRQLLAFSRRQVLQPRRLDLNAVVAGMEEMLRRLIGEDVELRTALDPGLSPVSADPGQLGQVLMNLVVNARDAMPRGGHLLIATRDVAVETVPPGSTLPPGRYVAVSVTDTGCGMDEETRLRAFEPFFTTKEVGKGTGLGLSTVYGIVQQSGGDVSVQSEPGRGTTIEVRLPRTEKAAAGEVLDARR